MTKRRYPTRSKLCIDIQARGTHYVWLVTSRNRMRVYARGRTATRKQAKEASAEARKREEQTLVEAV